MHSREAIMLVRAAAQQHEPRLHEVADYLEYMIGTASAPSSGVAPGEWTDAQEAEAVEAMKSAPFCQNHRDEIDRHDSSPLDCDECLRRMLRAALSRVSPSPAPQTLNPLGFDFDLNCPTHFVAGDPSCPACISKQHPDYRASAARVSPSGGQT